MDKTIKYAMYAGIIVLILSVPVIICNLTYDTPGVQAILLYTIYYTAGIIFMMGFKTIGEKTQNKPLKTTSYGIIAYLIVSILLILMQENIKNLTNETTRAIIGSSMLIIYGVILIAFAISLFKLENQFGKIATATAITTMIAGLHYLTLYTMAIPMFLIENTTNPILTTTAIFAVILYITMLITVISSEILGVILLYKTSKKL